MSKHLSEFNFELEEWSSAEDINLEFNVWISERAVVYGVIRENGDLVKAKCKPNNLQLTPELFWTQTLQIEASQAFLDRCTKINIFRIGTNWFLTPKEFIADLQPVEVAQLVFAHNYQPNEVFCNTLQKYEACFISTFDTKFLNKVNTFFPKYNIYHPIQRQIDIHLNIYEMLKQPVTACVELLDNYFMYLIIENKKIKFINFYPLNAPEDVVYHVFRVNQSLQMKAHDLHVYVNGSSFFKRNIQNLIKTYFLNLENTANYYQRSSWLEKLGVRYDDFNFLFTPVPYADS